MKTSGRKTVKGQTSAPMAVKVVAGGRNGTGTAERKSLPTTEQIAARSYELYLARGGADGHDVEDWLQAESELSAK